MWKSIVKNSDRYKCFKILDTPAPFNQLFADSDFYRVQLHSTQLLNDHSDIIGFVGSFQWLDNKIISLDYDSYNYDFLVLGYKYFKDFDNKQCIDILVGQDW